MRRVFPLICFLLIPAAASAADGETVVQGLIAPSNIVPTFDHGYLAVYEAFGFSVYKPDGSLAMTFADQAGTATMAMNVDIEADGSVVAALEARSSGHRTGIIRIFNADGSSGGEIGTGAYVPSQVCVAPDHSIWTLGYEQPESRKPPRDYFLLHHYSRAGELLGQTIPRNSFPPDVVPARAVIGLWGLRIAGGRIGAMVNSASTTRTSLWLEADLRGVETGRWPGVGWRPAALTESGVVYAQGAGAALSTLDRATGSWNPIPKSSSDILLGAEGNTLVFLVRGMNRVRRATQP